MNGMVWPPNPKGGLLATSLGACVVFVGLFVMLEEEACPLTDDAPAELAEGPTEEACPLTDDAPAEHEGSNSIEVASASCLKAWSRSCSILARSCSIWDIFSSMTL